MNPLSIRRSRWFRSTVPAALAVLLYSCSSGSSGGGPPAVVDEVEPNDTTATATALTLNTAGVGSLLDQTDVDFWSVALTEGEVISIELFGTRLDHADWDTADSIPRVTLYAPDGTTVLLNHDYALLWSWGKHDLDSPQVVVPETGTFFASVTVDGLAITDGDYAIRVNRLSLGTLQTEAAVPGVGNNTALTAEPIVPGVISGYHEDDDTDFFSFVITSPSVVRFTMTAYRNGVVLADDDYYDPFLHLYDTDGTTLLTETDDAYFYDSEIDYQIDTAGTYFIEVNQFSGSDGDAPYLLAYARSAAPATAESEPNDDTLTANAISYGGSIRGNVDVGDLDGFRFSGTKGDMVRVQLFDSVNALGKADEVLATIYAPDGTTALPFGGYAGLRTMTTILQETGTHFVVVEPVATQTDYRVELTRFRSATYEGDEPNDVIADADALGSGGRSSGVIGAAADVDLFRFSASANRLTTISVYASNSATSSDGFFEFSSHGSDLEPDLRILDSAGTEIASSTSAWTNVSTEDVINGLPCAAVSFVDATGGTFYVEVSDTNGAGGATFYYVIERTN